jgi:peptide/nickel transport system substrate-binding protein
MDQEEIAVVCSGEWGAVPADRSIWGFATEFRNGDLPLFPRDLDLARDYLAKSTYNGEEIEITASIVTNIKAAEVLQSQLLDIGINSRINATDTAGLNAQFFNAEHHIIFHGITFTYAAGSAKNVFAPGGAQNRGTYDNPEVTRLLTEAAGTTDAAVRSGLYKQIQALVAEDMPFVNIFWRLNGIVGRKGVGGLKLPSDTHQTDLRGLYWIID